MTGEEPRSEAVSETASVDAIQSTQQAAGATLMDYGSVKLVESFDHYEAEYAVIRKGAGLFDANQLGMVTLTGNDRADFLHRFVTNEVNKLSPGQTKRAFLLGRNGRIQADMRIIVQDDSLQLVVDRHDAAAMAKQLDQFLFSEDVTIKDVSADTRVLAIHGPQAALLLASLGADTLHEMKQDGATTATLAGHNVTVFRDDIAGQGAMGLHVICTQSQAAEIYAALVQEIGGLCPEVEGGVRRKVTGRGVGWMAVNTARIEAGCPMYHIDFGPDSLPHETSLIEQTVSFTKGCYVGQEIVARMHNLGHPKKKLVKLKFEDDRLPLGGSQVFDADGSTLVGAVTSSCLSPLAGNTAVALAMVKWGKHQPGTKLLVTAEGSNVHATAAELGG